MNINLPGRVIGLAMSDVFVVNVEHFQYLSISVHNAGPGSIASAATEAKFHKDAAFRTVILDYANTFFPMTGRTNNNLIGLVSGSTYLMLLDVAGLHTVKFRLQADQANTTVNVFGQAKGEK